MVEARSLSGKQALKIRSFDSARALPRLLARLSGLQFWQDFQFHDFFRHVRSLALPSVYGGCIAMVTQPNESVKLAGIF